MVEGLLRKFCIRPAPEPLARMSEEKVAQLLSSSWHRLLFAREPA